MSTPVVNVAGSSSQTVTPVMTNRQRMPQPSTKNAPKFEVEKPEELNRFFETMDDWYQIEGISSDEERKKKLIRYTDVETEQQWRAMPEFENPHTYVDFKAAILASYPKAIEVNRGSVDALKKKIKAIGLIDVSEKDLLLSLIRIMTAEVAKLKKLNPPIHTNRELVELFLKSLTKGFAAKVAQKLSIHRVSSVLVPGQIQAHQPARNTEDMFDISEVMEMAKLSAQEHANPFARYLGINMQESSSGDETIAKLEETVASLKDTITLQQNSYRMIDQKLNALMQTSNQTSKIQQPFNYGQRSGIYAPSGPQDLRCFYCQESGHRIPDCPHAQSDINKGWLKRVLGQLRLPDGRSIPRDGNKTMKVVVEEINKPVPGLISMARINKEHLYQGGTPIKIVDKEDEAANVLINMVQHIGIDGLKRVLQKENFHLARDEDDQEIHDQDFY